MNMKKIILLLFASIFCLTFTGNAQVTVGDNPTSIDARSLLELESTTKAFYLPRLSTAQAAAQTGWKAGMVIYNTTQNCVQYYDGTAWFCFTAFISVDNDKSRIPYPSPEKYSRTSSRFVSSCRTA